MGTDDDEERNARLERVEAAAQRWSEARKEWQLRQTFSTRCALDDAGDELQAVLEGRPVPPRGERAVSIIGALADASGPCPAVDTGPRDCIEDLAGWLRYALENWAPSGSDKAEKARASLEAADALLAGRASLA